MALINIEYGSLASSDTMNKNFMYLDDKIADTSDSLMTSISSILSNIATINARLNDITENMDDSVQTLNSTLEDYKTKTKMLVNKASLIPDWKNCVSISFTAGSTYTASSKGYILLLPTAASKGSLVINGNTVTLKNRSSNYDNASQLMAFPVNTGDTVYSDAAFSNVYFLPTKDVSLDDF